MKNHDIIKLLKDKKIDLSREELEKIIEKETNKSIEEMDTDLIEYCLDALNEANTSKNKKKASPIKYISLVAAAAVLVFTIIAVVPSISNKPDIKIETTKLVTTETQTFLAEETSQSDSDSLDENSVTKGSPTQGESLKTLLNSNGYRNILLPKSFYSTYKIASKNFTSNSAHINLTNDKTSADIFIEKTNKSPHLDGTEIDTNGLSVFVKEKGEKSTIKYFKDNLNYTITLEMDFNTAILIAKTLT